MEPSEGRKKRAYNRKKVEPLGIIVEDELEIPTNTPNTNEIIEEKLVEEKLVEENPLKVENFEKILSEGVENYTKNIKEETKNNFNNLKIKDKDYVFTLLLENNFIQNIELSNNIIKLVAKR